MADRLHVAFVWHMHQPFYRDSATGRYTLPWVRLHAVKDYLHVARIIRDYPEIHQTINVVPSLAEQLQEYADGRAVDEHLALSRKTTLTADDKRFLLREFFSINWDRFVWPQPRYAQLARLREAAAGDPGDLADSFWTDLVAWFNLAWIDPTICRGDPKLRSLVERQRDFSRVDVDAILAAHRAICGEVLPLYRELMERGQVELTTSPYYHPILPLLVNTRVAREASQRLPLPTVPFAHPEDAREQIARAVAFHRTTFGRPAAGIWPSEGAVSAAAVELIGEFPEVRWIASDEHVLERALAERFARDEYGHLLDPRPLCQPYRLRGRGPAIFFRDQTLSDRVGFAYQHWDSRAAADDLVDRLLRVQERLAATRDPAVIAIVLDGENCWEYYPNNGDDFLRALFERLGRETALKTITPSEYLDGAEVTARLDRLPAGSWIASNLETWIGEPDQNRAWELLALARSALAEWEASDGAPTDARERAWQAMRIAEGSDWFWWYYSRNRVGNVDGFDARFRAELANVYHALARPAPAWLDVPIARQSPATQREPAGLLHLSVLDAGSDAEPRWAAAGLVEPDASTGAMQRGTTLLRRLYYGNDATDLLFRVEYSEHLPAGELRLLLGSSGHGLANPLHYADQIGAVLPVAWRIDVPEPGAATANIWRADGLGGWTGFGTADASVARYAAVIRISRAVLGDVDEVAATAALVRGYGLVETLPSVGAVSFRLAEVGVESNETVSC